MQKDDGLSEQLVHIDEGEPGITRRRAGKGWCYFRPDGSRITNRKEIDRLNAIALPPAYADAWFSPRRNGHILAFGTDEKGRRQYRYHPAFIAQNEERKFAQCEQFGEALPTLRRAVLSDLEDRGLGARKVTAAVVRLLDLAALRVGNECYVRQNGSYGATTLRQRHAHVKGQSLRFLFRAKSGKQREVALTDRHLAPIVRRLGDLPGQHLFQYIEDGSRHPVTSSDVNSYIRERMGGDFTAKHFRTWAASVLAFERLVTADEPPSVKALCDAAADLLGNSAAVARSAYIHPAVLDLAETSAADTLPRLSIPGRTRFQDRYERGLLAYLRSLPH